MSPRRRISDQPHPAYTPGAGLVLIGIALFWALIAAASLA